MPISIFDELYQLVLLPMGAGMTSRPAALQGRCRWDWAPPGADAVLLHWWASRTSARLDTLLLADLVRRAAADGP